jgi:peptidyl-prolyl cis-trans isomerase C
MTGPETIPPRIRSVLREPLVHFLIAGFLVFLLSLWRGGDVDAQSRTIHITEDKVARLSANWEQIWRRPPTQVEIDSLIRDYIKEEVYYREAKRLGLDEDDTVIRRRLRSKMEFLAKAQVENAQADDQTLQRWLQRYPERFAIEIAYDFDQIYLGENGQDGAAVLLKSIAAGADWRAQGRAISLPRALEQASISDIARQFGDPFVEALSTAPLGTWAGPFRSGFGNHLVRVRTKTASGKPALATVRQQVENDWRVNSANAREAEAYQALLDGYTIKIAKP